MHRPSAFAIAAFCLVTAPVSAQPVPHGDGAVSTVPAQVVPTSATTPGGVIRLTGINSPDRESAMGSVQSLQQALRRRYLLRSAFVGAARR